MWLDKCATWKLAAELGGDRLTSIIVNDTHTCYMGERSTLNEWGYGCANCPACELRMNGFNEYKKSLAL